MFGLALAAAVPGCAGSGQAAPHAPQEAHDADAASAADQGPEERRPKHAEETESGNPLPPDPPSVHDDRNMVPIYGAPDMVVLTGVPFRMHSTRMLRGASRLFESVAETMKVRPDLRLVEIQGHADASEGKAAGWLAKARAQVVRDELVRLGVDPSRLRVVGYGASKPVRPRGDRHNARVGFKVVEVDD